MANNTGSNPVFIDTFGGDVTIGTGVVIVTSIVMEGATAGDTATFIDSQGVEVLRLSNGVNGASAIWTPSEPFKFPNGLIMDDSASSLAAGDFILVYKV